MPLEPGAGAFVPLQSSTPITQLLNLANTFVQNVPSYVQNAMNSLYPAQQPAIGQPLQPYVPTYTSSTPYQVGLGTSTPATPVVNVSVQPTPVNVYVPDIASNIINNVLPAILNRYAPGVVPFLDVGTNIASILSPAINQLFSPFASSITQMVNNFSANFQTLQQSLNRVMQNTGINASTDYQSYVAVANNATNEILKQIKQDSALGNQTYTQALQQLTEQNRRLNDIAETALTNLEKQVQSGERQQTGQLQQQQTDVLQVLGQLIQQILQFIHDGDQTLGKFVTHLSNDITRPIGDSIDKQEKALNGILKKLTDGSYKNYSQVFADFTAIGGQGGILAGLFNIAIMLVLPMRFILSGSEPYANEFSNLAYGEHPTKLLDPASYVSYLLRSPSDHKWTMEQLGKLGLNDTQVSALVSASLSILPPQQIIMAMLRGIIDKKSADRLLSAQGYDSENKEIIQELAYLIPPISDIIGMMVHDVFSPADRARYQLDIGYPEQLTELAAKQGLSEYWAKNYWAGHWQYPGANQVFEMYHRRNSEPELAGFSKEDVDDFLRLADYSPVWRPRLRAISFTPLGRIDIRRIYKAGGKDIAWLKRHYEADGYSESDVSDLIEWTVNTQLPEDETDLSKLNDKLETTVHNRYIAGAIDATEARNILSYLGKSASYIDKALPALDLIRQIGSTRNEIEDLSTKIRNATIAAKTRGNLSTTQAKNLLVSTGMTEQEALLNLHYADLQYSIKLKETAQNTYQAQYAVHNIEENEFRTALAGYEFSPDEIDRAFLEAQLMRANKTKKPTEVQIEKWYKDGVIDDNQVQEELRGLGLNERYVQIIYQDIVKKAVVQ